MGEPNRALVGVGLAATGQFRTIARAMEHAADLEEIRAMHGEAYMRLVERVYLESPWGLQKAEWHARRLAVFQWMATA